MDFKQIHRSDHALHRHEDVLVDQLDEAALVLIGIAGSMDDPHLLDKRRFPGLASPLKTIATRQKINSQKS